MMAGGAVAQGTRSGLDGGCGANNGKTPGGWRPATSGGRGFTTREPRRVARPRADSFAGPVAGCQCDTLSGAKKVNQVPRLDLHRQRRQSLPVGPHGWIRSCRRPKLVGAQGPRRLAAPAALPPLAWRGRSLRRRRWLAYCAAEPGPRPAAVCRRARTRRGGGRRQVIAACPKSSVNARARRAHERARYCAGGRGRLPSSARVREQTRQKGQAASRQVAFMGDVPWPRAPVPTGDVHAFGLLAAEEPWSLVVEEAVLWRSACCGGALGVEKPWCGGGCLGCGGGCLGVEDAALLWTRSQSVAPAPQRAAACRAELALVVCSPGQLGRGLTSRQAARWTAAAWWAGVSGRSTCRRQRCDARGWTGCVGVGPLSPSCAPRWAAAGEAQRHRRRPRVSVDGGQGGDGGSGNALCMMPGQPAGPAPRQARCAAHLPRPLRLDLSVLALGRRRAPGGVLGAGQEPCAVLVLVHVLVHARACARTCARTCHMHCVHKSGVPRARPCLPRQQ